MLAFFIVSGRGASLQGLLCSVTEGGFWECQVHNVYCGTDTGDIGPGQRFFLSACCFLTYSAASPLSIMPKAEF